MKEEQKEALAAKLATAIGALSAYIHGVAIVAMVDSLVAVIEAKDKARARLASQGVAIAILGLIGQARKNKHGQDDDVIDEEVIHAAFVERFRKAKVEEEKANAAKEEATT